MIHGQPLATFVHQFRTPLNAILGFAGTLLMKLPGPLNADQEMQLKIIQKSARELSLMVDTLMDRGELGGSLLQPPTPEAEQTTPIGKIPNRLPRVLLIDDEANSRKLMAYLLTAFGYEALIAEDGAEGLVVARREVPDLILCDLQLPTIGGEEVARELRRDLNLRHIPLVAISAAMSDELVGGASIDLFDSFVVKPIEPEALAVQLASVLRGCRSTRVS